MIVCDKPAEVRAEVKCGRWAAITLTSALPCYSSSPFSEAPHQNYSSFCGPSCPFLKEAVPPWPRRLTNAPCPLPLSPTSHSAHQPEHDIRNLLKGAEINVSCTR